MKKGKKLLIEGNINDGRKVFFDAICGYEIYETEDNKREVIICKPKNMRYEGVGTSIHFERFATRIRRQLLEYINPSDITWYQRDSEGWSDFPPCEMRVVMEIDPVNYDYKDAMWLESRSF